ncbi:MAG: pentapeptide repeat-containing protein [Chloroflexi bacterium]|nr:MAG: pentapeptide repeat-containing protein [Chloroflexota bacterium]
MRGVRPRRRGRHTARVHDGARRGPALPRVQRGDAPDGRDAARDAGRGEGSGVRSNESVAAQSNLTASQAMLSQAMLSHATLSHAMLSQATLSHAMLSQAMLSQSKLSHAMLSQATLSQVSVCHGIPSSDRSFQRSGMPYNAGYSERARALAGRSPRFARGRSS